jgi:hypothetical protein
VSTWVHPYFGVTRIYVPVINIDNPLEKIEGGINHGKSRDTGNIGHRTQEEDKESKKTNIEN